MNCLDDLKVFMILYKIIGGVSRMKIVKVWLLVMALVASCTLCDVALAREVNHSCSNSEGTYDRAQVSVVPSIVNRYIVDDLGNHYYFLQLSVSTPGDNSTGINGYVFISLDNSLLNPVPIDDFSLNRTQAASNPNVFTYGFVYSAGLSSCYVELTGLVVHTLNHGNQSVSNLSATSDCPE